MVWILSFKHQISKSSMDDAATWSGDTRKRFLEGNRLEKGVYGEFLGHELLKNSKKNGRRQRIK